jgi:hypothetical protein
MNEPAAYLFFGSVEFADPTLLISGDEQTLLWLADQIAARQLTSLRQGHPSFVVADQSITLVPIEGAGRLRQQQGQYEWRISEQQAQDFAERLRVVAKSTKPVHAYLDTDSALQIVASKGEYDLKRLVSE